MNRIHQQGSALIISLIILLLVTIIGVSSMQGTSIQERMTANTRQINLTFHAAEAGVREIEAKIKNNITNFSDCENNEEGFIEDFIRNKNQQNVPVINKPFDPSNENELPVQYISSYCRKTYTLYVTSDVNPVYEVYTIVSIGYIGSSAYDDNSIKSYIVSNFASEAF